MSSQFSILSMASLFFLTFLLAIPSRSSQGPPSPGYYPSSKINSIEDFRNQWGRQHRRLDQTGLTIWLDSSSGSFFPFSIACSVLPLSYIMFILGKYHTYRFAFFSLYLAVMTFIIAYVLGIIIKLINLSRKIKKNME